MFGRRKKYSRHSDEELMRFSGNGDEKAFEEIYDRYAGRLFTYFCRMLRNDRNKAEDFVQDLFAKIVHRPEVYNTERPFKTWLFSVANNMCKNAYRHEEVVRAAAQHLKNGVDRVEAHEGTSIDREGFRDRLEEELAALDPDHKATFVMRYHEEMAIKEIAAAFGCSEGTVKSRLFYTLKKLAGKLKEFGPNAFDAHGKARTI